jgi:hypothetical protein
MIGRAAFRSINYNDASEHVLHVQAGVVLGLASLLAGPPAACTFRGSRPMAN